MAKQHSEGFIRVVESVKPHIKETNVEEISKRLQRGDSFHLVDVREAAEYAKDHIKGALHLGKGVIERDIEGVISDHNAPIVLYCGGGYRSALAAYNLQIMGYKNVLSMDGGYRGWKDAGLPFTKDV